MSNARKDDVRMTQSYYEQLVQLLNAVRILMYGQCDLEIQAKTCVDILAKIDGVSDVSVDYTRNRVLSAILMLKHGYLKANDLTRGK